MRDIRRIRRNRRRRAERERALLATVRAHGARLIGPNCLGIASTAARLNATFAPHAFPPGRIGFASQSGALGLALLERASERALGSLRSSRLETRRTSRRTTCWSTGKTIRHRSRSAVPGVVRQPAQVRTRRPARQRYEARPRAEERHQRGRCTRSGSRPRWRVGSRGDALFHEAGVIRSDSLEDLLDVATLLAHEPLPRGNRVAVVTNAGGLGILRRRVRGGRIGAHAPLVRDLGRPARSPAAAASLRNPVDMLGSATAPLTSVLAVLLDDPRVDAVIVLFVPAATKAAGDVATAIDAAGAGRQKPVVRVLMAEKPPPGSFPYPESGARALARAVQRAAWLRRPVGSLPSVDGIDRARAREVVERALAKSSDSWLAPAEYATFSRHTGCPRCGAPGRNG